jgi:hypothetical protein
MIENDPVVPTGDDGIAIPVHPARGYAFENGAFVWHNGTGQASPVSCEAIASNLNEQIERANRLAEEANSPISADDWRLEDMWREAARLADRAGHCSVYDDLVRELGGLPRERDYVVTIPVSGYVSVTVTASNADEAIEIAQGIADEDDAEDLSLDWYNAEANQD